MLMRLLLLALLIFIAVRLLRSLSSASRTTRRPGSFRSSHVSDMIQDPHCGVYIARKDAFPARTKNGMLFFCSEECCRKYLQKE